MEEELVKGQIVAVRRHSWSPWEIRIFIRREGEGDDVRYICRDVQGWQERWRDCVTIQKMCPEAFQPTLQR